MNQNIKELVKSQPDSDLGNMKLGEAIRELYYSEEHQDNVRASWVCSICGKNTYDVDWDYIGSDTNHLACELKGGKGSKGWLGMKWPDHWDQSIKTIEDEISNTNGKYLEE